MINYYNKKFPEKDELIVCKVKRHNDSTIELKSLEYESTNPYIFILHSEITKKKRCHNITSLLKIGQIEVFEVFSLEINKNTIEVSKKNITLDEKNKKLDEYQKETKAMNILKYIIKLFELDNSYFNELIELYESPFKIINNIKNNKEILNKYFNEEQIEKVIELINHHYAEKETIIRTDFELTYFGREGIDAIKQSLRKGQELGTQNIPITIKYIKAPTYTILSNIKVNYKQSTIELHNKVCEVIEDTLKSFKGLYTFKSLGQQENTNINTDENNSDESSDETDDSEDEEYDSSEDGSEFNKKYIKDI